MPKTYSKPVTDPIADWNQDGEVNHLSGRKCGTRFGAVVLSIVLFASFTNPVSAQTEVVVKDAFTDTANYIDGVDRFCAYLCKPRSSVV